MLLEPIHAEDFAVTRRSRRKSPAACRWQQFVRLALLMTLGFALVSTTLNPRGVLSAASNAQTPLKNV